MWQKQVSEAVAVGGRFGPVHGVAFAPRRGDGRLRARSTVSRRADRVEAVLKERRDYERSSTAGGVGDPCYVLSITTNSL